VIEQQQQSGNTFTLTFLTRNYPEFEYLELETVAKIRTNLLSSNFSQMSGSASRSVLIPFSFSKYKNIWIYIFTTTVTKESKLKRTTAFSVCLFTEVRFNDRSSFLFWFTQFICLLLFLLFEFSRTFLRNTVLFPS
jgi:hypothetical protein